MYLFQDHQILQCIHRESSGYFHQYRDPNRNVYYSIEDLKRLLMRFLVDSHVLVGANRAHCLELLSDLLETGCAVAAQYDERVFERFGDVIQRKKELMEQFIAGELGVNITYGKHPISSYWAERFGHQAIEAKYFLGTQHASHLHVRNMIDIRCLSKGPFSSWPVTNGDAKLSYARGEWYTFQTKCDWHSHREVSEWVHLEEADQLTFSKTESTLSFLQKQLFLLKEAKSWLIQTNQRIHEQLEREFDHYAEWQTFIKGEFP